MIFSMLFATGGYASQYVIGLGILLLTAPLAIPWQPRWSLVLCAVVVSVFVAGSLIAQPTPTDARFLDNLFALLATSAIAVVATRMAEKLRWREFHTRWTLAEAYRHKSEFFANMSHELRTPIHVIVGYVDMLLEGPPVAGATPGARGEAREMLDRVRGEGMLLYRLVSDLLDYAKVEAGKMEVTAEAVVVADVLQDLGAAFRPLAERSGLDLQIACDASLTPIISDRQKLEQVLRNLLSNAIKFTPVGAVRLRAAKAHELLRQSSAELVVFDEDRRKPLPLRGQIAIAVEDTGIGIRRADIDKLAIDFQQIGGDPRAQRGTGLGLSLSRKLVTLLGGRLAVRSTYGQGTSFIVLLPAATPESGGVIEPRPRPPLLRRQAAAA
jgi:signal transduction histidine kinase